ncbi:MAG: outer membrane protein assembly factor BamD [Xanthobacteraceae bacterium]|jgi:outer membrane protein assembly factor BamD|nr:outer membrane protein assembly factor BamD [Xanthobacteraceae bacterium]MBV9627456.1 outer membrane protein assembly factor BamD [Xanthobacteraceae bacterium]
MGFGGSANRVRTCGRATTRALVILCALASLGACSGLDLDKFNIFAAKEEPTVDVPADQLYNQAVFLLNEKKDYKEAAKKFEEVDRQHPYSDWARKSLIMSAFAYYEARQYDDCIASAKRYISLHPGSAEAPYAQYLIGASYFDQIPDVSRDQSRTEKAIQALDELNRKYPSSEYASDARKKIEMARDQLAAKEMETGRYLMRQKDFIGAINRFKVVVTQYQTTRHVEEALLRLTECYMTLGIVQEAQTAAAVLGHNFPDSKWYKEAYDLVKSGGLEPKESDGWLSQAFKKVGLGTLSQR